jgi:hypothetical protein
MSVLRLIIVRSLRSLAMLSSARMLLILVHESENWLRLFLFLNGLIFFSFKVGKSPQWTRPSLAVVGGLVV